MSSKPLSPGKLLTLRCLDYFNQNQCERILGEIITACRAGVKKLVDVKYKTLDREEKEDFIQDVCIRLIESLRKGVYSRQHAASSPTPSFYTWAGRVVDNMHTDRYRIKKVAPNFRSLDDSFKDADDMSLHDILPSDNPFEIAAVNEEMVSVVKALHAFVQALKPKLRLCFSAVYFDGMTYAQAAEHLGFPEGTIKACINRAKSLTKEFVASRNLTLPVGAYDFIGQSNTGAIFGDGKRHRRVRERLANQSGAIQDKRPRKNKHMPTMENEIIITDEQKATPEYQEALGKIAAYDLARQTMGHWPALKHCGFSQPQYGKYTVLIGRRVKGDAPTYRQIKEKKEAKEAQQRALGVATSETQNKPQEVPAVKIYDLEAAVDKLCEYLNNHKAVPTLTHEELLSMSDMVEEEYAQAVQFMGVESLPNNKLEPALVLNYQSQQTLIAVETPVIRNFGTASPRTTIPQKEVPLEFTFETALGNSSIEDIKNEILKEIGLGYIAGDLAGADTLKKLYKKLF